MAGVAETKLAGALRMLHGPRSLLERFGSEFVGSALAHARLSDDYREQRQKGTAMATTTHTVDTGMTYDPDAADERPRRRVHVHLHGFNDEAENIEQGAAKGTNGAQRADGKVGPRLVMKLPLPASAYQLIAADDGSCGLFVSSPVDGTMDPGAGNGTGNRLTGDQKKLAAVARQRDAARSRGILASINEAHRKMWGSAA